MAPQRRPVQARVAKLIGCVEEGRLLVWGGEVAQQKGSDFYRLCMSAQNKKKEKEKKKKGRSQGQ